MISVEDRRYYSHFGIDPVRTGGAIIEGMTGSRARVGGTSTISQQLARNVFLNNNRSLDRKLREAILAMALEWKFSKEQILELYLNKVYFGGGAYGIDSASRKFFSHPATELSVAEAAIIAGLVKAPSRYSPTADVDAAVGRASVVLRLMKEQGRISPDVTVDPSAVRLKEEASQNSVRYFTDWALPQLDLLLPETFEPIEVWTTLDVGMQRAATASIKSNTPDGAQGAMVSMDRDGAVLALVGGTDYVQTNYNRATDAMRQPGSSWKLFVYLAALESGYTPDDRVVDTPVDIDGWRPRNSSGRNVGEIDLRTAFAYSINTVAAQLGNEVGFTSVASMARRFGITTEINTYPAMVLGSNEVRLIDMTRAFAAVSAQGESVEPYGILKVETADGELLYQHEKPRSGRNWCPTTWPRGSPICCRPPSRPAPGAQRRSGVRLRARPGPPARTRTAISSASPAASPPAYGWAATTMPASADCRAGLPRRAPSPPTCAMRSRIARSRNSTPICNCPNGNWSRTMNTCSAIRKITTSSTSRAI